MFLFNLILKPFNFLEIEERNDAFQIPLDTFK